MRITDPRRVDHISGVLRAAAGDALSIGLENGPTGRGVVTRREERAIEMDVTLDSSPPAPLPLTLVLALPRPKVLNRVIASSVSLGIKTIYLINAWRVEKSYWNSPRLSDGNLRQQCILGLEQAGDTIMPRVETRRFFRRFVEEELPNLAVGAFGVVAHPGRVVEPVEREANQTVLAIGPEGGFIDLELESLERAGLRRMSFGVRPLRVETIVPFAVATLCGPERQAGV